MGLGGWRTSRDTSYGRMLTWATLSLTCSHPQACSLAWVCPESALDHLTLDRQSRASCLGCMTIFTKAGYWWVVKVTYYSGYGTINLFLSVWEHLDPQLSLFTYLPILLEAVSSKRNQPCTHGCWIAYCRGSEYGTPKYNTLAYWLFELKVLEKELV